MNIGKRLLITILVSVFCVACDQISKILAADYLPKNTMFSYLNDTLRVGYTENIGAFLGLGNRLSEQMRFWLFVVLVGAFLLGLLFYIVTSKQTFYGLIALSLTFSGGLSNFYDRVVNNGAVIDFLNVGIGSLRTGIFNVADVAIMVGVCLFIFTQNKITTELLANTKIR